MLSHHDQHENQNRTFSTVLRVEEIVFHVHFHVGDAAGQFIAPPPTCPGDTFTFRCTVTGDMNGVTIWRVGGSSKCILTHSTASASAPCGPTSPLAVTAGTGFGMTGATSFSSTLSGTAIPTLNGTLVECFGPAFSRDADNMVGNSTLQIVGQYYTSSVV